VAFPGGLADSVCVDGNFRLSDLDFRFARTLHRAQALCSTACHQFCVAASVLFRPAVFRFVRLACDALDFRGGNDCLVLLRQAGCGMAADSVSSVADFRRISRFFDLPAQRGCAGRRIPHLTQALKKAARIRRKLPVRAAF